MLVTRRTPVKRIIILKFTLIILSVFKQRYLERVKITLVSIRRLSRKEVTGETYLRLVLLNEGIPTNLLTSELRVVVVFNWDSLIPIVTRLRRIKIIGQCRSAMIIIERYLISMEKNI